MFDETITRLNDVFLSHSPEVSDDIVSFIESLIIALIFGITIRYLYGLYFRDNEPQDGSLARSLVLLTPSLTAIFWLIQSSVVLSLGLLGSMSFVRFRTPVKRSEDVTFIVLALGIAIACATRVFLIGIVLVVLFLGFTLVRNFFGDGLAKKGRFAIITFNSRRDIPVKDIISALSTISVKGEFVSSRTYDGITSYVFNAAKLVEDSHDDIKSRLEVLDSDAHINIFYPNDRLGA